MDGTGYIACMYLPLTQAAAVSMKQHGVHGKIVFVSSVLGFMGMVGYAQYSPMKYAIRGTCLGGVSHSGLAECLRMELLLHGIQVHCYFPATILSPGFEEENKTKPSLTKEIEGTDEGQTPEQCAAHLLRGIERHYFSVTDGLIGSWMRIASNGCAPGQGWLSDSLLLLPARVRMRCSPVTVGAGRLAKVCGRPSGSESVCISCQLIYTKIVSRGLGRFFSSLAPAGACLTFVVTIQGIKPRECLLAALTLVGLDVQV